MQKQERRIRKNFNMKTNMEEVRCNKNHDYAKLTNTVKNASEKQISVKLTEKERDQNQNRLKDMN